MRIARERLSNGACLELSPNNAVAADPNETFNLVLGTRGCSLRVTGPAMVLWAPLRGRLQIRDAEGVLPLPSGKVLVSDCETRVDATGRGCALWVAVVGLHAAWRAALSRSDFPAVDPVLLPVAQNARRSFKRRALCLARVIASSDASAEQATLSLLDAILELQAVFEPLIARCPGRTYSQRRNVFLRLQRVCGYMEANCQLDLDIDTLARMASYSPCHFIRTFCAAFEVTPHAYLVNQRLLRVRRLLRSSQLGIAEIASASGFENRCAFARLFRRHFGSTASEMRKMPALAASL